METKHRETRTIRFIERHIDIAGGEELTWASEAVRITQPTTQVSILGTKMPGAAETTWVVIHNREGIRIFRLDFELDGSEIPDQIMELKIATDVLEGMGNEFTWANRAPSQKLVADWVARAETKRDHGFSMEVWTSDTGAGGALSAADALEGLDEEIARLRAAIQRFRSEDSDQWESFRSNLILLANYVAAKYALPAYAKEELASGMLELIEGKPASH